MKASEPKWVKFNSNIIGVNSLRLGGLQSNQIQFLISWLQQQNSCLLSLFAILSKGHQCFYVEFSMTSSQHQTTLGFLNSILQHKTNQVFLSSWWFILDFVLNC